MAAVVIAFESAKVRSASQRRFHVIKIIRDRASMEVRSIAVARRSDSIAVARKAAEASSRSAEQIVFHRVFDSVRREFV